MKSKISFTNATFGSRLLETITDGLYDGNVNCIKEYVQNSIDSKAKNIEIFFENGNLDLIIKDDGNGMVYDKLVDALKIGKSDKGESEVGWRGIGIWSGISASEKLVIITKAKKHSPLKVVIDNNNIRSQYDSERDAIDILNESINEVEEVRLAQGETLEESQYTIVRLESILYPQQFFFTPEKIEIFLAKTVPSPFNSDFKLGSKINSILESYEIPVPTVNIYFQGKKIFRPPYNDNVYSDEITIKEFVVNNELIAIGWFLTVNTNDQRKWPDAGIIIKKKGFTTGDENLISTIFTGHFYRWQFGEIHVISDKIRENAARSRFEYNGGIVHEFIKSIEEYISNFQQFNRFKSAKIPDRTIRKAEKSLEDGDLVTARNAIEKVRESLANNPSIPSDTSFKGIISTVKREEKNRQSVLKNLDVQYQKAKESSKTEQVRIKREHYLGTIGNCRPAVKKQFEKISKKPIEKLEINVMEPVKDLLQSKTGLKINEFKELSKESFGWGGVSPGNKDPLITIDPLFNKNNPDKMRRDRNMRFGVLIYALQDLLVNIPKHESGQQSFEWFENTTEEEKYKILSEMAAVVDFSYRFIENAKQYK
nr:ATP-binding protein [uncultured Methanoregula sp.]